MKKILFFAFCVIFVIFMVSCVKDSDTTGTTEDKQTAEIPGITDEIIEPDITNEFNTENNQENFDVTGIVVTTQDIASEPAVSYPVDTSYTPIDTTLEPSITTVAHTSEQ